MRKCGWKKEEQGFDIDVIVSVRHPSRSSFLRARPRARKSPPSRPRRAAPAENYPLTTGCLPFRLLFHLSSVSLPARSSTHRLQYYHLPLSQALPPTPSSVPRLSLFFAVNDATPPRRGGTRPLIYTCTSDHNINFNDGRDENIRTPRYLWRLSQLASASLSSRIRERVIPPSLARTIFRW